MENCLWTNKSNFNASIIIQIINYTKHKIQMEKKTPNIATFDMPHVKHYSFPKIYDT